MVYETSSSANLLIAKWQGVNSLLVCQPNEIHGSKQPNDMHILRWNIDVQNSVTRKLLNETHGIFMELQESCEENEPDRDSLLQTSLNYRAIIQSCVIRLREKMKKERQKEVIESMENEMSLLNVMEMIWHLCEVLLVKSKSGSYCLKQLLKWMRTHFNEADILGQAVMSSEDPCAHEDFWPAVYRFVMQGRLDEVCNLLTHHPYREQGRFDAFANIEDLMRKMPNFDVHKEQGVNDFISKWQQWQFECSSRLRDGDFSQHPELETICKILSGDDSAILNLKELFQSWYEMMITKLLYSVPNVKTFNLKQHAIECMETFNGIGKVTVLDEIILSIMSFDVHKVIEKCSDSLSNWWLSAHLTDLLYHCGLLKSFNFDYGSELREFLLQEFSASLMSHSSLWIIAADYLISCPTNGREHLEAYIEKIPLDNEKKALKVIHLCDKYGFTEQSHAICHVMGMKALRRKRLGVALSWCLRAKDEQFASILTDQFLNHYMETGCFLQCDLIDNLGSSMLLNNELTFLGKYYEFHKLYLAENYKDAGSLLVSLLTSNLAPKKFWMILLVDTLPLLENNEMIFSSEQTYELMQCLTELQLCQSTATLNMKNKRNKALEDDEKDQVELLQLALSRNLSRALLV